MIETILGGILNLATGTAGGAALGMLGSWLTKKQELQLLQVKNDHELALQKLGMEELKLQSEIKIDLAETEGRMDALREEIRGWAKTLSEGEQGGLASTIGAMTKGAMRPLITLFLLGVSSYLAVNIHDLVGGMESMGQDELLKLYTNVINQIVFLASTCTLWWFGTRPSSQPRKL